MQDIVDDSAPMLPQEENYEETKSEENQVDLQKELEAKFDELFGPVQ